MLDLRCSKAAGSSLAQAYQHLFYLLQTNPNYFAKLIFEMPQNKTNRFMENVILTVFNYAQNSREQFLLTKLFERALGEEIEYVHQYLYSLFYYVGHCENGTVEPHSKDTSDTSVLRTLCYVPDMLSSLSLK